MRPEDILALYSLNSLRTMARVRNESIHTTRRPELIAALAERLFDAAAVQRLITQLTPSERAVLHAVAESGGRLPSADLAQRLHEKGLIDGSGPVRPRETIDRIAPTTRRFDELCARLTAFGLLFSEMDAAGTLSGPRDLNPGAVVFVPGPVIERLRQAGEPTTAPAMPPVQPPDPGSGRLIVQPSYTVLALPPLDDSTLERLHSFAEPVRVAEIGEFKLTQSALFGAVERGATLHEIMRFLEARSGGALPQNVRYTLEQWGRSFEQAQFVQAAAIIEGAADLVEQVAHAPAIAPLIVRRLSPERLLLRDVAAVEQALYDLGELPAITRYDEPPLTPRLAINADDTITVTTPDLLLPLTLRRIATPLGSGRYQPDAELVRTAAATTPDGVTGLIKWLRAYAGEIPPTFVQQLRIWALDPDAVALEQPLLLRLPADLLDDLRALPELAPLLADEYRPAAALVRIDPAEREHVVAMLRAHGVVPADT